MTRPLVVVCGPTGSGKSSLAIHLAQRFSGEVINADSVQVFRHFDIGTAKVPPAERGGVPHHLIDVADGAEGFTAGDFARLARAALAEINGRGRLPILAGGTGFYLRALITGLSPGPPSDAELRVRLGAREERRPGALHRILRRLDPEASRRIHARDVSKVIRALEFCLLGAGRASEQPPRRGLEGYQVLRLTLMPPRSDLYRGLDERCEDMLRNGLLAEIEALLGMGVPPDAKPLQSLGYKEGLAMLRRELTADEALQRMQRDTRRYAKRQMTWFRHEPGAVELHGFGGDPEIAREAEALVTRLLHSD